MTFRKTLILFQAYIHIMFIYGLFIMPYYLLIPVLILNQIIFVGLCGTVFYHRIVSHKNYINPTLEKILLILSWVGITSSALAWAGVHRKHHRYSDTEKDPHNPLFIGKWRTYWQLSDNDQDSIKYVPDLLRKPWYVFQHKYYFHVLIILHLISIISFPLEIYWSMLVVPAFLMWFSGSTINVFCHDLNGPKNVNIIGLLHAGEGWHRNHHDDSSNPKFSNMYDWGYLIYYIIKRPLWKN